MKVVKNLLKNPNLWSGFGSSFGMDYVQHPDAKIPVWDTIKDIANGDADRMRILNLILNGALGAGASSAFRGGNLVGGAGMVGAIPAKDLLINLQATPSKINEAAEALTDSSNTISGVADTVKKLTNGVNSNSSNFNTLLGILGVGALLTGGIATAKYLGKKDPKTEMGKIKLKLPGSKKDPDSAAEVELPIDMPDMSPNLIEGLNRGVRLQARKNVRANSFKRDPRTGKLIPYEEWKARQAEGEHDGLVQKSASTARVVGSSIVGTIGGLLGGLGGVHLAQRHGGGIGRTALAGILGLGLGGFGGALTGKGMVNALIDEEEPSPAETAAASFSNTGASPRGFVTDDSDEYEELDKYAAMGPPPPMGPPPRPQSQLARRPVMNTLPPAPAPAHKQAPGMPGMGSVKDIAANLRRVNDNVARVLNARKTSVIQ